jgi:hypothetical protein
MDQRFIALQRVRSATGSPLDAQRFINLYPEKA